MKATTLELKALYEKAEVFKSLKAWESLSEYQLFVVEDPTTQMMGFCCIMGKTSEEKGLKVYLGIDGLYHYMQMIENQTFVMENERVGNQLASESCLTVTFNCNEEIKFMDYLAGFVPVTLSESWQCQFLTTALQQVAELSTLIQTTPSFMLEGDQVLMRLQNKEGVWQTFKVSLGIFLSQMEEVGARYENELEAYRISKLPTTNMIFEIAQFLIPRAVEDEAGGRSYYPMITAVIEQESKKLVFAEMSTPSIKSQEMILSQFARTLLKDLSFKPQALVTSCDMVMKQFKDFSEKTMIPLHKVDALEASDEFIADLMSFEEQLDEFLTKEGSDNDSVDLVLSTAQDICEKILSSDSLSAHLSINAKKQFSNIVELFHLVMIGHFHEFPDYWSQENVERACKEVLPNLLTKEELKLVPEIITYYLDIVGEAELMPQYSNLQQCVNEIGLYK